MSPSIRLSSILVAATIAAALGACGGDNQPREAATVPTTSTSTSTSTTAPPATTPTAAGGAQATTTTAGGGNGGPSTDITIVAKGIAFSRPSAPIPAGKDVTITFDNQDSGVLHNLHLMTPTEAKTDFVTGPAKATLKVKVDAPGSYEFTCDVHPTTMKGQLTVA